MKLPPNFNNSPGPLQPSVPLKPGHSQSDQFFDQFSIRQAGRLPEFRIHGDVGEAGEGVGFVVGIGWPLAHVPLLILCKVLWLSSSLNF